MSHYQPREHNGTSPDWNNDYSRLRIFAPNELHEAIKALARRRKQSFAETTIKLLELALEHEQRKNK
ncbi:hypothetical protein ACRTDR_07415 [Shewanella algae]